MQGYIERCASKAIVEELRRFPAVVVLGPRSCGKSTLYKEIAALFPEALYLDLERASDLRKLDEAQLFLGANSDRLVCIDGIQKQGDILPLIEKLVKKDRRLGRFLLFGSLQREDLGIRSESLDGLVTFVNLTPLLYREIEGKKSLSDYWLRGAFPLSLYAEGDSESVLWRSEWIGASLERATQGAGFRMDSRALGRLLTMLAADQGGMTNCSRLGRALGLSHHSVRKRITALEREFMLRILPPWPSAGRKRLVKSPKIYIRDSGLLHSLLGIRSFDELMGRSILASSWEGLVMDNLVEELPEWRACFYKSQDGAEIDLVLEKGERRVAVAARASMDPLLSRGFYSALADLDIREAYVASPVEKAFPKIEGIAVGPPQAIARMIRGEEEAEAVDS